MQTVYSPKVNSIEYPHILVFVPYVDLLEATLISLIGYNYIPVKTSKDNDYSYGEYFKQRWDEGKTFISIEQDIIIWPGALEGLWDCPREWCMYDFHLPNHRLRDLESPNVGGLPLGCMKISDKMIKKTKDLWDKPCLFSEIEWRLTPDLLQVHQHFPGIVNANKALLGFANYMVQGGILL